MRILYRRKEIIVAYEIIQENLSPKLNNSWKTPYREIKVMFVILCIRKYVCVQRSTHKSLILSHPSGRAAALHSLCFPSSSSPL